MNEFLSTGQKLIFDEVNIKEIWLIHNAWTKNSTVLAVDSSESTPSIITKVPDFQVTNKVDIERTKQGIKRYPTNTPKISGKGNRSSETSSTGKHPPQPEAKKIHKDNGGNRKDNWGGIHNPSHQANDGRPSQGGPQQRSPPSAQ